MTGAQNWTEAGKADKEAAIREMRLAKEEGDKQANYGQKSPTMLNVESTVEKVAGKVVGCEGMKERATEKAEALKDKTH